ncbi:LacI family transcriptional regulator [Clostridia bacterium]|nr:LacI family transcriptional regulator [Clostridia bacterium]
MTLKDIAEKAEVSVSTVSRVLNSPDNSFARKEVRDRIWKVVQENGYIPNQNAKALKQGNFTKSQSGALSCILGRVNDLEDNPFFEQLGRVIEQRAMQKAYPLRNFCSSMDEKALEGLKFSQIDGVLVLGRLKQKTISFLEKQIKNRIYIGRNPIEAKWDQILCDGYEAAQIALEYLISMGHRRIAYLGEIVNEVRYRAYLDLVKKYKLDDDKRLVCQNPQNGTGGVCGLDQLLTADIPLPSAIFCATDVLVLSVLKRLRVEKIKVPEQISLIGIDNIQDSGYASPMLTTVEMPILEMGSMAVQVLLSRIQKQHQLPVKIYFPNKLIIRESVKKMDKWKFY